MLIGLRNLISHGYEQANPERIWAILDGGLTKIAATIETANPETGLPLAEFRPGC